MKKSNQIKATRKPAALRQDVPLKLVPVTYEDVQDALSDIIENGKNKNESDYEYEERVKEAADKRFYVGGIPSAIDWMEYKSYKTIEEEDASVDYIDEYVRLGASVMIVLSQENPAYTERDIVNVLRSPQKTYEVFKKSDQLIETMTSIIPEDKQMWERIRVIDKVVSMRIGDVLADVIMENWEDERDNQLKLEVATNTCTTGVVYNEKTDNFNVFALINNEDRFIGAFEDINVAVSKLAQAKEIIESGASFKIVLDMMKESA